MMRNHKQPISEVNLTAPDQINNVRALEDKREYFDELPIDLVEDVDQVYGKVSLRVQALVFDNSQTILQGVVPDHQTSRSTEKVNSAKSYLGYDPIEKQFKVLSITWVCGGKDMKKEEDLSPQHQVLTLENGGKDLLWRNIDCCNKGQTEIGRKGQCIINGVLYYPTSVDNKKMIVCFDVRSERFELISWRSSNLINYKGKLGAVDDNDVDHFALWVLVEREWSKHVYEKSLPWRTLRTAYGHIVGVTDRGEVVFSPKYGVKSPFYIFYTTIWRATVP
ncbi:hypothetical protein Bca4012_098394 [Brassica carinata]